MLRSVWRFDLARFFSAVALIVLRLFRYDVLELIFRTGKGLLMRPATAILSEVSSHISAKKPRYHPPPPPVR